MQSCLWDMIVNWTHVFIFWTVSHQILWYTPLKACSHTFKDLPLRLYRRLQKSSIVQRLQKMYFQQLVQFSNALEWLFSLCLSAVVDSCIVVLDSMRSSSKQAEPIVEGGSKTLHNGTLGSATTASNYSTHFFYFQMSNRLKKSRILQWGKSLVFFAAHETIGASRWDTIIELPSMYRFCHSVRSNRSSCLGWLCHIVRIQRPLSSESDIDTGWKVIQWWDLGLNGGSDKAPYT